MKSQKGEENNDPIDDSDIYYWLKNNNNNKNVKSRFYFKNCFLKIKNRCV